MYEAEYFKKQRGFSNTNVSEDMEFAYRTVMDGYCIKYEAGAKVCHSHSYTLRSLYKRYFQIGCFFGKNRYFENFKTAKEGKRQTKFILYNLIKNAPLLVPRFIAEVAVKFIGFKIGEIKCKN
jgi:rhamnosyltransferase